LLFVDADVGGFDAETVATMYRAPLDVVAGACPMKAIQWEEVAKAVKAGSKVEDLPASGARYAVRPRARDGKVEILQASNGARFIRVEDAGTGFMMIRRDAIERFIAHYRAEIEYVADYPPMGETHHMVFQADRDPLALKEGRPARYLGEDYWFCRKWQMMGGEVHLLLDAKLTHTGTYRFEGDMSKRFEVST
jgi:hypothetical protein